MKHWGAYGAQKLPQTLHHFLVNDEFPNAEKNDLQVALHTTGNHKKKGNSLPLVQPKKTRARKCCF